MKMKVLQFPLIRITIGFALGLTFAQLIKPNPLLLILLLLAGFNANKHPRRFVKNLGMGTLALAQNGIVYVSEDAFLKGTKLLAHALIEETWHLEYGYEDETRAFQTFLSDNILTLIEKLNQEAF